MSLFSDCRETKRRNISRVLIAGRLREYNLIALAECRVRGMNVGVSGKKKFLVEIPPRLFVGI